jgi:leucyl aminopeptidase
LRFQFAPLSANAVPVWFVTEQSSAEIIGRLGEFAVRFAAASGFEPSAGRHLLAPDASGGLAAVIFAIEGADARDRDPLLPGKLATLLPAGVYRFANAPHDSGLAALAFLLGLYRFTRYRAAKNSRPELVAPEEIDAARIETIAESIAFGRELINTPANDLSPDALEQAVVDLARFFDAPVRIVRGDALRHENFPLIHAVGRAAAEAPRLVEFSLGREGARKVTLVGKGVTFDTGGLDIKPASGMEIMKKDMGGAAAALSLARMIAQTKIGVRLRVLIPIVENAISASAFRPGDVIRSRKGLTVEIGNTDAEGRLILADALALADEESPELLIDFATLTGAARVALGPDLPPFYTDDEALAADIARHAGAQRDPLWRLPLWRPYDAMLTGKIADISNAPGSPFAGSITAALFLQRFVTNAKAWAHFDVYAWNPSARPHGPEGGEVQAARALFSLIAERYGP